jgi:putative sigma-54 modulation protein
MKIDIRTTNIELTAPLREYIEIKIGGIERLLGRFDDDSVLAVVDVGRSTNHHKKGEVYYTDITLDVSGKLIHVKKDSEDVRAAIDEVKDILKQQVTKYLEQLEEKR